MVQADSLQNKANQFAADVFEHIRQMSADTIGVSRQGYSDLETQVQEYLMDIARQLDMTISRDPAGNVWMRLAGRDPSLPALVSGSHSDSVYQAGNYDGMAGVVAALTVAWWMRQINFVPRRDYVVLIIRNEESSYFGKAYVGSLGLMGQLTPADLALKHRFLTITLGEAIRSQGVDPEPLTKGKPLVDLSRIAAFIELHIEQGPMLDGSDTRVGIVTGIRGNYRHKRITCLGQTAHSGAVDKAWRHDAVMAFAELAHAMENHWQAWIDKGEDLVFTIGVVNTAPNASIAAIPGQVSFSIDMRSLKQDTLDRFYDLLRAEADAIAQKRGVSFEFDRRIPCEPAEVSAALNARMDAMARQYGLRCRPIPSGAGHDAAVLGNAGVPVAMIFVANQHGSHNPNEALKIEDFIQGTDLLWRTVQNFEDPV